MRINLLVLVRNKDIYYTTIYLSSPERYKDCKI